jgi:hypothetical protein
MMERLMRLFQPRIDPPPPLEIPPLDTPALDCSPQGDPVPEDARIAQHDADNAITAIQNRHWRDIYSERLRDSYHPKGN